MVRSTNDGVCACVYRKQSFDPAHESFALHAYILALLISSNHVSASVIERNFEYVIE
ncbi:MAG TPA: hypothetical protein VEH06_18595 [Candidatus Bathyarchaeia archaeon]|nr:hypothetical protein [Candidatus Bathyarchaeia archaeon]